MQLLLPLCSNRKALSDLWDVCFFSLLNKAILEKGYLLMFNLNLNNKADQPPPQPQLTNNKPTVTIQEPLLSFAAWCEKHKAEGPQYPELLGFYYQKQILIILSDVFLHQKQTYGILTAAAPVCPGRCTCWTVAVPQCPCYFLAWSATATKTVLCHFFFWQAKWVTDSKKKKRRKKEKHTQEHGLIAQAVPGASLSLLRCGMKSQRKHKECELSFCRLAAAVLQVSYRLAAKETSPAHGGSEVKEKSNQSWSFCVTFGEWIPWHCLRNQVKDRE